MNYQSPILTDERAVKLVASRPDLLTRAMVAAGKVRRFSNTALTARQKELLDFIREYASKEGICPSYDEMLVALGLKSKSGVFRIVAALEERGHITRHPNRARSISLIEEATT